MSNKLPITRLSKFFSTEDYDLNIKMGQEYLHGDLNFKLVLFRVDRNRTSNNSIYGEVGSNQINYLSPIEFNALVEINEPSNKTYQDGLVRYNEPGNMVLSVYIHHLSELKIDITYGDYIGYLESEDRIRYYNVIDDGKISSDNKHSMLGYRSFYRTIICSPIQEGEFNGV
jgi:hypothetical protein